METKKPKFTPPPRNRTKAARFDVLLRKVKKEMPVFNQCKRCGMCCGPLKLHVLEWQSIRKYLNHHELWKLVRENYQIHKDAVGDKEQIACYFLAINDEGLSSCIIYPVRPIVCRLQGLKENLKCPNAPDQKPIKMTERMNQYYDEVKENGLILNQLVKQALGLNKPKPKEINDGKESVIHPEQSD